MAAFAPGDTVRLKSGGPLMTVSTIDSLGKIWCEWLDAKGTQQSQSFEPDNLTQEDVEGDDDDFVGLP